MTIQDLIQKYSQIRHLLWEQWPIEDKDKRVLARNMKLMEEVGELSDAILSSMKLQRTSKLEAFSHQDLENEWADVLGTLLLLAIELDIPVEETMKRKIAFTLERLQQEKELTAE